MIYECTDCKHCASFADGWRVLCCNPEKPAGSMADYHPVGERDAIRCEGFDDSEQCVHFPMNRWGGPNNDLDTYDEMRAWVMTSKAWCIWRQDVAP